jgi:hypothetical protein
MIVELEVQNSKKKKETFQIMSFERYSATNTRSTNIDTTFNHRNSEIIFFVFVNDKKNTHQERLQSMARTQQQLWNDSPAWSSFARCKKNR